MCVRIPKDILSRSQSDIVGMCACCGLKCSHSSSDKRCLYAANQHLVLLLLLFRSYADSAIKHR